MSGLFANARFAGFGPDPLRPHLETPAFEQISARRRAELRKLVRKTCPRLPGVYGMLDAHGRLIYVGKAKVLRTRLLSYFLSGNRELKAGRIIDRTRVLVWEPGACEFAALVRELELIRRWKPNYNVQGVPGRERQVYVCLGRKPAPYLYVARQPSGQEVAYYGPVKGVGMANAAARRLNDLFKLRDCSQKQTMRFAEQRELFPILHTAGCLRYELNTCVGPCAGFTSRATYARHVRAARDLLDGSDQAPLRRVQAEMEQAAGRLEFERAAAIRDKIAPVEWLLERLVWVEQARQTHSYVYPLRVTGGGQIWYLIRQGRVCAAVDEPSDEASSQAAAQALNQVYGATPPWERRIPVHLVDHVLLVAGWFRKNVAEKARLLSPTQALQFCEVASGRQPLVQSA